MSELDVSGDILNPGSAERSVEKVVTRQYLYKPRDETPPPPGENWFEHNYPLRPSVMSIKVQIDPKEFAQSIDDLVQASNMPEIIRRCQAAKIEVISTPGSPIITLKILP